ncbi:uncharacterized protein LOC144352903 [Saccoglossus kowalevskii]
MLHSAMMSTCVAVFVLLLDSGFATYKVMAQRDALTEFPPHEMVFEASEPDLGSGTGGNGDTGTLTNPPSTLKDIESVLRDCDKQLPTVFSSQTRSQHHRNWLAIRLFTCCIHSDGTTHLCKDFHDFRTFDAFVKGHSDEDDHFEAFFDVSRANMKEVKVIKVEIYFPDGCQETSDANLCQQWMIGGKELEETSKSVQLNGDAFQKYDITTIFEMKNKVKVTVNCGKCNACRIPAHMFLAIHFKRKEEHSRFENINLVK